MYFYVCMYICICIYAYVYICMYYFLTLKRFFNLFCGCLLLFHMFWSGSAYVTYENPSWYNGKQFYPYLLELENNPSI